MKNAVSERETKDTSPSANNALPYFDRGIKRAMKDSPDSMISAFSGILDKMTNKTKFRNGIKKKMTSHGASLLDLNLFTQSTVPNQMNGSD
jgi:hypothetical protein